MGSPAAKSKAFYVGVTDLSCRGCGLRVRPLGVVMSLVCRGGHGPDPSTVALRSRSREATVEGSGPYPPPYGTGPYPMKTLGSGVFSRFAVSRTHKQAPPAMRPAP